LFIAGKALLGTIYHMQSHPVFMTLINAHAHDLLLSILLLVGFYGCLGAATTDTFTGTIDQTWENPGNWSTGLTPQNGDAVIIPATSTVILTSESNAIGSLLDGGTIEIGAVDGSSSGDLEWEGTQVWSGAGQIIFNQSQNNSIGNGSAVMPGSLTIDNSLSFEGTSGSITCLVSSGNITNNGVIDCTVAGGSIGIYATFVNHGTVRAQTGGTVNLEFNWTSDGVIVADGGTIQLYGTFATSSAMTVSSDNGGSVFLIGTLNNTGATLSLDATTGSWFLMGEIDGGTISTSGGSRLIAWAPAIVSGGIPTSMLNGVTIASGSIFDASQVTSAPGAQIEIENGLTVDGTIYLGAADGSTSGSLYVFEAQSWGGTGQIILGRNASNSIQMFGANGTSLQLTVLSPLMIAGGCCTIGAQHTGTVYPGYTFLVNNYGTISSNVPGGAIICIGVDNFGSMSAENGGSLLLEGSGPPGSFYLSFANAGSIFAGPGSTVNFQEGWSSSGPISGNSAIINLGGAYSSSSAMMVACSGGSLVNITGNMDNTGSYITLDSTTGPWNLSGGEISNGDITTSGADDLIATPNGGTLNGISLLAGSEFDMTQPGSQATIINGLVDDGSILVGAANVPVSRSLYWSGSQIWSGTGSIVLGMPSDGILHANTLNESLTIVPPLVIEIPLVITAVSTSRSYGSPLPVFSFTTTSFFGSDSLTSVDETTPATSGSAVGVYQITPSRAIFSGGVVAEYVITYVPGNYTITQAPLVIAANDALMNAGDALPTLSVSFIGFVNGDTSTNLITQPTISTTATSLSAPGSYLITVSGVSDPNYTFSYVSGVMTVQTSVTGTGSGSSSQSGTTGGTGTNHSSSSSGGHGCGIGGGGMGLIGLVFIGLRGAMKRRHHITASVSRHGSSTLEI
jgi:hypothetical protein